MPEKVITFDNCDYTSRDEIISLFPTYMQEQIRLEKANKMTKTVDIEMFTLMTPYKDKTLLKDTSLLLEPNKRHCLYGGNGTGKTTLFQVMADGSIKGFPKHLNVHHCKELEHSEDAENVLDTILHAHPYRVPLLKIEAKITELLTTAEGETKQNLQNQMEFIQNQLRGIGSETAEHRVIQMLRALGFDDIGQKKSINDLSGGLRMRVALAMAFFVEADLLLLDEPTNHLDFPSVLWLENRLRGYKGSFLLVTHDRDLLVNVTTSVLLLEDLKIKYYNMGFGQFEKQKAKDDKKKADEIERFIKLNHRADPSTPQGRMLVEKKAWTQNYYERVVRMQGKFTFPASAPLDNPENLPAEDISLIKLEDVRFSYNESTGVFIFNDPISFNVTASSRVGIMGPNGAGKSTLLKLLTSKLTPTSGTRTEHGNYTLAYFGQHSTAELQMEQTPMEFMMEQFPEERTGKLRDHLKKTGVTNGVESTRMENLSYSQRSCVIFSKLTFVCPHLLIMDEPTNFLDLESVESLISATNKYKGALLVVTHSRHFLKKCATQFLSVVPGQFLMFDNMKTAEQSTYTFITEMENGGKFDAKNALPGGGSVHASQTGEGKGKAGEAATTAAVEAAPTELKFKADDVVLAYFTDKKFHDAIIQKIACENPPKYTVKYIASGVVATVPEKGIKKGNAAGEAKARAAAIKQAQREEEIRAQESAKKAVKDAAKIQWANGDKCLAMTKDGRWFEATIVQVRPFDQIQVNFTATNVSEVVAKKRIRAFTPEAVYRPTSKPAGNKGGNRKKTNNNNARGGQRQGQSQRGRNTRKQMAA